MSLRSSAFLLLMFAVLVNPLLGDSDFIVTSARGIGTTPDAAKKDALINAMQQAIGTLIDSETMIANDQVIKDKFLAVSDGFVSKYDIVTPATSRADGLYEISINATVQKGKVIKRLEEVRVMSGKVSGKDVAAEALTKIENAEQGNELLVKNLDGLLEKLLIARLIGEDGKPDVGARPRIEIQADKRVKCTWNIEVYFDMEAFYKQAAPKIDKLLSAIGTNAGSAVCVGQRSDKVCYATNYPVLAKTTWQGKFPLVPYNSDRDKNIVILLSVGRDKFGENERFRWHVIDRNVYGATIERLKAQAWGTQLHFYVNNANEGVIREDVVSLKTNVLVRGGPTMEGYSPEFFGMNFRDVQSNTNSNPLIALMMSPRFCKQVFQGDNDHARYDGYSDTLVLMHESVMEKEDIANISEVRFQFK